ncbi:hypothetical protein AB0K51_07090 [Kitasatospora sp. NPDC049285]|uniref:hypothetical protein n=1 Tax=Kitasatospora sp. NPDC049285 TaxID=3157096 RepID=UPI00342E7336
MTLPTTPAVRTGAAAPWRGSDRVTAPLRPALAALGRLDRLGRPTGPVLRHRGRAVFLLAPGTAEAVPALLCWLGWGAELRLPIEARWPAPHDGRPTAAHPETPRVPAPRTTADWLRVGAVRPVLDLRSPDLLRLLDALADACARERLGLPPAP